jgi:undecaprenyl-diphosphatase
MGMDGFITFCGKYLIAVSVLLIALLFFRIKKNQRKRFAIQLVLGGLLALVISRIVTHLYYDPRPFVSDGAKALYSSSTDNGFPSDHTLLASLLAFTALIYSRKIGAIMLALAVLVAWGRVAGGVHHAVDVLASFAISGVAVLAAKLIVDKYLHKTPAHSHQTEISSN